eukprot:TRINITY_DN25055_c0_g1_i1.p1 TRINITY_DN25055_c0_g1~~TRINITY_DN25055_c0_g1_i1.p1  ORF type:complete len:364 (-),score=76.87 TRINITY_DN25055_c0_g1_i1:108-1142(-)
MCIRDRYMGILRKTLSMELESILPKIEGHQKRLNELSNGSKRKLRIKLPAVLGYQSRDSPTSNLSPMTRDPSKTLSTEPNRGSVRYFQKERLVTDSLESSPTERKNDVDTTGQLSSTANEESDIQNAMGIHMKMQRRIQAGVRRLNRQIILIDFNKHRFILQPKFMSERGTMCITELWADKMKRYFYSDDKKDDIMIKEAWQLNIAAEDREFMELYRPKKQATRKEIKVKLLDEKSKMNVKQLEKMETLERLDEEVRKEDAMWINPNNVNELIERKKELARLKAKKTNVPSVADRKKWHEQFFELYSDCQHENKDSLKLNNKMSKSEKKIKTYFSVLGAESTKL